MQLNGCWLPVWLDLAKICHFGKSLQVLVNFQEFISYLAKYLAYFGKFVTLLS